MAAPRILPRAIALASTLLFGLVWPVLGHAELRSSDPANGATITVSPPEVSASFSEPLDPATSRLIILDAEGERVAEGGVPADDASATTMRLQSPALVAGTYEVRWTARTPDDGAVTRGRWTFTIEEAGPSAPPTPAPSADASPSPMPPAATATAPSSSASLPPAATARPSPSEAPQPAQGDDDPTAGLLVPLLALGAVAGAAVILLARRPR